MHSIRPEWKIRLPDPSKVLESAWKLLGRTRGQIDTNSLGAPAGQRVSSEARAEKRRAHLDAERQRARGVSYGLRTIVR